MLAVRSSVVPATGKGRAIACSARGDDRRAFAVGGAFQCDQEFVAAGAGDQVGLAHAALQARGRLVQHLVADAMTVGGVDAVEMVEVGIQHPHRLAAARGTVDGLLQALVELAPARQRGERIGEDQRGLDLRGRAHDDLRGGPAFEETRALADQGGERAAIDAAQGALDAASAWIGAAAGRGCLGYQLAQGHAHQVGGRGRAEQQRGRAIGERDPALDAEQHRFAGHLQQQPVRIVALGAAW
jgi:hypothetical protein